MIGSTKVCTHCHETKPEIAFAMRHGKVDTQCRSCRCESKRRRKSQRRGHRFGALSLCEGFDV